MNELAKNTGETDKEYVAIMLLDVQIKSMYNVIRCASK